MSQKRETNEFYIFNESGKLDKNELYQFLKKVFTVEIPDYSSNENLDEKITSGEYLTGEEVNIRILRPSTNESGLIDHIKYGDYLEKKIMSEKKTENKFLKNNSDHLTCFNVGNQILPKLSEKYSHHVSYPNVPCKTFNDFFKHKFFQNWSQFVFELVSGDEYSSPQIERCILFTGVLMANTIILNIPENHFSKNFPTSPYEYIFKIIFVYSKSVEYGIINDFDAKDLIMVIKEKETFALQTLNEGSSPDYKKQIILELGMLWFCDVIQKVCMKIVKKSTGKDEFRFKYNRFQSIIHFVPFEKDPYTTSTKKDRINQNLENFYLKNEGMLLILLDVICNQGPTLCEKSIKDEENRLNIKLVENGVLNTKVLDVITSRFEYIEDLYPELRLGFPFDTIKHIEIIAEISCSKVVQNVIELTKEVMSPWFKLVKSGWVQGLGTEINELFKKVRNFYKTENRIFQETESFRRKLYILEQCFFLETRVMFYQQLEHLKEDLQNYFKSACNNVSLTEDVEIDLNQLIEIFDKEFAERARGSIPDSVKNGWNFNYERGIFKRFMTELVDEKMKMNYFKGLLVKKVKSPVSIWFHSLFPHPFGKDLTNEPFSTDDVFSYDTRENHRKTKAALMRYVISKKIENWKHKIDSNGTDKSMTPEDFIFTEKPKKAVKRLEKNR